MDIEKYIIGTLKEAERREMEAAMAADPTLRAEVETRQRLQMGLEELYLQNKVQQVGQARHNWLRRRWWLRLGGVILLMAVLSVAVFFIWKKPSAVTPDSKTTTPELQQQSPEENKDGQPVTPKKTTPAKPKRNLPIAEGPSTPNELNDQPLVRGVYEDLDSLTINLIDQLLKETAQNKPTSTITDWQKVLQLLREGKPTDASALIFKMEANGGDDAVEARWLLGISLLAQGKTDEAETVFAKIARTDGHPRQELAKQALLKLQE